MKIIRKPDKSQSERQEQHGRDFVKFPKTFFVLYLYSKRHFVVLWGHSLRSVKQRNFL